MRNDPKSKGERSEGAVLAALLKKGYVVLLPFGDNQRYDLVVDSPAGFQRIQCKTGKITGGAIAFSTCSVESKGKHERKDYCGQADLFGVFVPDLDKVYLVPVDEVPGNLAHLRLTPTKNGQKTGIRLADHYELR